MAGSSQCGSAAKMAGVWTSACSPNIAMKIPHHTRMLTPLRQRTAAMAQAVAPMDKKTVPRTMSVTWARSSD